MTACRFFFNLSFKEKKGSTVSKTLIQDSSELDPYSDSIFMFSGWSKERYQMFVFGWRWIRHALQTIG